MREGFRLTAFLAVVLLLVWGCTPSTSPSRSVQPSVGPTEAPLSGLPPGCEPIDLRDLNGDRIALDGEWIEVGDPDREPLMTWWLHSQGDCVWGAGQTPEVSNEYPSGPDQVQSLSGRIGSDFVITGEILVLGPTPGPPGAPARWAPLRMLIDLETDEILLREDRESDDIGPRCPGPASYCAAPLVLQRAD